MTFFLLPHRLFTKQSLNNQGFTLIELLVAVTLFALISALAYSGLASALKTREHAEKQADRLAALQKCFLIMGRDFEQVVAVASRDGYGNEEVVFEGGLATTRLRFSRNGRRNPGQVNRSHLQRIAYQFEEETLTRQSWWTLTPAIETEPQESPLLSEISEISFRFLDQAGDWYDYWPAGTEQQRLPRALTVIVQLKDWGEIQRIFRLGGDDNR